MQRGGVIPVMSHGFLDLAEVMNNSTRHPARAKGSAIGAWLDLPAGATAIAACEYTVNALIMSTT